MKRNNGSRGREGGSVTLLITAERDSGKNNARVVRFLIVSPRFMRSFLARALRYNRLMPRNNEVTWLLIIIRCGGDERNVNRILISLTNRFAWVKEKKKINESHKRVCFECTWRACAKRGISSNSRLFEGKGVVPRTRDEQTETYWGIISVLERLENLLFSKRF